MNDITQQFDRPSIEDLLSEQELPQRTITPTLVFQLRNRDGKRAINIYSDGSVTGDLSGEYCLVQNNFIPIVHCCMGLVKRMPEGLVSDDAFKVLFKGF
ncbi:hypothetical protein [Aeromonas enteropelogenes]|uniref:hypothetical protein n=1 Tax=Aeromonas enteropelogenes TaxID=29489 RepID=UPI003BA26CB4